MSSFALKDKAVEDFEAGLRKQGALSAEGQMSQPIYPTFEVRRLPLQIPKTLSEMKGESSSLQEPDTPTTPALYASPTSPSTPAIPFTPPQAQSPRHTPSPTTYTYESRFHERAKYPPSKRKYSSRRRSATSSSLASSSSRLSPVALPIGKKLPKWREPQVDSFNSPVVPESAGISGAPSAFNRRTPSNSRLERGPAGPRPMTNRRPSATVGLGIGVPRAVRKPSVPGLGQLSFDADQQMRRRRRRATRSRPESMLSTTSSRWSDALHLEPDVFDADSQREAADSLLEELNRDHDDSDHHDFSWEAAESSSEDSEGGMDHTRGMLTRISPPPFDSSRNDVSSPLTPDDVPPLSTPFSFATPAEYRESPSLEKPFDLDSADSSESTERSAFDWDTEDEADASPKRSRGAKAFDKVRTALRPSVSVSNFKPPRVSVVISPKSATPLESSPESVAALRERQRTTSSTRGTSYFMKLALNTKLSPIPATPIAEETPHSLKSPDLASSIPTPDTPLSPQLGHAQTLLRGLEKIYPSLAVYTVPPPPTDAPNSGPPDFPLPPTPVAEGSPYISHRTRRSSDSGTASFVERWRRQIGVDPDMSIARLEQSLAKLEACVHRDEHDGDDEMSDDELCVEHVGPTSSEDSADTGASGQEGVVIISVEPSRRESRPRLGLGIGSASTPVLTEAQSAKVMVKRQPSVRDPAVDPQSFSLLPSFDFEQPGHQVLDLRGLPVRTTSRLSLVDPPSQIQTLTTDSASYCTSSGFSSIAQTEEPGLAVVLEGEVSRCDTSGTPTQNQLMRDEGLSSFMNISPNQKHQSKIRRRLFSVRSNLIQGLRSLGA